MPKLPVFVMVQIGRLKRVKYEQQLNTNCPKNTQKISKFLKKLNI